MKKFLQMNLNFKKIDEQFACSLIMLLMLLPVISWSQSNSHSPTPVMGKENPNILWIYIEDTNPWMSCYGEELITTPNIDKLAEEGVRFDRAYVTAPVCTPCRSGIITGMYATSIGAHEHYSSFSVWRNNVMEVWEPNHLGIRTLPEIFKAAGYYTFNEGKNHYNFVFSIDDLYDQWKPKADFSKDKDVHEWSGREREDQPFFGQIQLVGGKVKGAPEVVKPEDVKVPPYYPDHQIFREEIARHYNNILYIDEILENIVSRLKEDGLYENTVIFFFSDHGMEFPRSKQFLYEGGIRVPLIIAGPGVPVNQARKDLVSGIDISATTLALAGIRIPDHMQGMDMFADDFHRDYVVSARDRCDFTIDRIRSITTDRYKYIRNFMTDKPYMQSNYRDNWPALVLLKEMYKNGELNEVQSHFVSDERPAEEFYDLWEDPHETNNLVHSWKREHAVELAKHRDYLYHWILETDDKGRFPETNNSLKAVIDRWGDKAVNKEYKRVREE